MGYSSPLFALHCCVMVPNPVKELVCSPPEASAAQGRVKWSLLHALSLRNHCTHFKLSSQLSALLNRGLKCCWLAAAAEIPLRVIALRVYSSFASKFWENMDLHICGTAEYLSQIDQTELWLQTPVKCAESRPLGSSQPSALAYFQTATILKIHFVSCSKFHFHPQSEGERFGKPEQKNLFIQFWVVKVWNECICSAFK